VAEFERMNYLTDTHPAAERAQINALQRMSVGRRMALMRTMTGNAYELGMRALRRARPHATQTELLLWFVELNYGEALASKLRTKQLAASGTHGQL
jgi:hypothetical protein